MGRSFGLRNSCLAGEHITYGPVQMRHGSECCDEPDLSVSRHPGAKFPRAEFVSDLREASDDLIHVRALFRVFLNHVGDKRLHELEAKVPLVRKRQVFCFV